MHKVELPDPLFAVVEKTLFGNERVSGHHFSRTEALAQRERVGKNKAYVVRVYREDNFDADKLQRPELG